MVDFNVNGKSAVITGGTRGLGLYIAEAFALNGASTIIITSRKAKAGEESKQYLEKIAKENGKSPKVISIPADLSKEEDANNFFTEASKHLDKLDILIANAGASWGAPLEDHSPSAIKKVLDLNVVGVFHTIQLFAPLLEKAGSPEDPARVLITSSTASLVAAEPVGTFGYLASKAGVSHLGKNLAIHLGPRNITVNSIAPGFFPSKMSNGLIEMAGDLMKEGNPRKRLGVKEDIQNLVLFLSSKQSNYINGTVIPLDGGAHLTGAFVPSKM